MYFRPSMRLKVRPRTLHPSSRSGFGAEIRGQDFQDERNPFRTESVEVTFVFIESSLQTKT